MTSEALDCTESLFETYIFEAAEDGVRLDRFVSEETGMSRSQIQRLIESQNVSMGGKALSKNYKVKKGDVIEVQIPENEEYDAAPENIPLDIVYEDEYLVVVNKPSGMVVHPAPGHPSGTLVNALMYHCGDSLSGIGGVNRPGIVHRIDRDTSGLICVAKNDFAHVSLSEQLKDHSMHREYRMILRGTPKDDAGTVNAPIGRHAVDRKKMAVIRDGHSRDAVTHWRIIERFHGFSYCEAILETGRTHQIRVHMSYIGHPLVGDTVYGGGHTPFEKHNSALLDGQMLHAHALILTHPKTGEKMRFESSLPHNFEEFLERLRKI